MSTLASKLVLPGVIFALTLASGFWLSHSGKPYSSLIFNLHKLIALAAVVAVAVTIHRLHQAAELRLAVEVGAILVTALLLLSLVITGGLMNVYHQAPTLIRTIHHAAPYLALISSAATCYLLASGK